MLFRSSYPGYKKYKKMKATIEFNLDNPEDVSAHKRCVKALDMALALNDILNMFRNKLKYGELSGDEYDTVEKIRDEIREILDSNNISMDELIN